MKAFFDTSVLVGAFYGDHPRHAACLRLLEDASKKTHFCVAHGVVELYAVMTRLPVRPRITSEQGLLFVENVRDNLSVITLSAAEQFEAAAEVARRGGHRRSSGARWGRFRSNRRPPAAPCPLAATRFFHLNLRPKRVTHGLRVSCT